MKNVPPSPPDPPGATLFPLAPFHLVGIGSLQAALGLWFVDPWWALWPPAAFLLFSFLIAPFVQPMQFFLPIVTRGPRGTGDVALTIDDGPDPLTTPALLDLLEERGLKATFFLSGRKAEAHPDLTRTILDRGHEVGNHSHSHDVFLMLRSRIRIRAEIRACQETLEKHGIRPLAFRPPVGVTNPLLWRVLLESGMYCAGFSRRAGDMGNLRVRGLAGRILKRLTPGDVVLVHDCRPWKKEEAGCWLREIRELLDGIGERGLAIRPLSQVIRRPVMEHLQGTRPDPVRIFYDVIASCSPGESSLPAARAEKQWFVSLEGAIRPGDRVLEIGAGMGRFTLPMAREAREVVAVDISHGSLEILRERASRDGLNNIRTVTGDVRRVRGLGLFDVICSFSAFEYFPDLQSVMETAVERLKPGGRLYFTTAHRTVFRFFVQIGNAMRQGIWLHARTRREVVRLLEPLGMEEISVTEVGVKSWFSRGMVLAVSARKGS